MTTGGAIAGGLGLARRSGRAVWVLFFANLGLAAAAALPIYRGILAFTGHSLMSQSLARGFPVDWMADFATKNPGLLDHYASLVLFTGFLSILVDSVLAGGVLGGFQASSSQSSLGDFSRDCGRYAWRLVRLTILGLIAYWIVFRVLNQALGGLVDRWTADWLNDRSVFWVKLIPYALVLLALAFVNLVVDYARVRLVAEDGGSAVEAFLASLGFSLKRLGKVFVVYAVPSLCGLAVLAVYGGIMALPITHTTAGSLAQSPLRQSFGLAILFIVQQATILGRYWFRVATWASEWTYYSGTRP